MFGLYLMQTCGSADVWTGKMRTMMRTFNSRLSSERRGDSPLSQRSTIANGRYCHVMYKLLYPSIRVRTAPPISVRVRVSVSFSLRIVFCMCGSLRQRPFAIADLNQQPSSRTLLPQDTLAPRHFSTKLKCRSARTVRHRCGAEVSQAWLMNGY